MNKPDVKRDIELYKRLLGYLAPYKGRFALVVAAMMVTALAEPALAALVKPLLDGSFVEKDPVFITYIPLALLGVAMLRALGGFAVAVGMNWVTEKVTLDIRNEVFSKIVMLPASFYDEHSTGQIIARLLYHVDNMRQTATQTLVPLIKDSVTVLALLAWIIYLNWKLSLTIVVLAPVIMFAISTVSRRLRRLSHLIQNALSNMLHTVEEPVRNQKAVKIFLAQRYERERTHDAFNAIRRLSFKAAVASGANAAVIQIVSAIAMASVVYFSSIQSLQGEVTVGGFVSFFGAMALLLSPIKRLAQINEHLQRGLAAAESVFEVLDLQDEPSGGHQKPKVRRGTLEFKHVSFSYPGHEEPALKDVSFTASPGETVAIVGLSGSGKSTLAALIPLLYRPTQGSILIDGIDTTQMNITDVRRYVSYVSQEILLFNESVRNNIAYGQMQQASDEEVLQAATAAHVTEFVSTLPNGLHAPVGQNGQLLSGGQRQRVVIARAILKDAPILIFDEATSALDTESERRVQDALRDLARGRTLIVIAHRLSTIESADKILVLDNGAIAEQGTHASLLEHDGIYKRLHGLLAQDAEYRGNGT